MTGDLRAQIPSPHLDTALGPPREPRWAGVRPEITPARAAAIREKRAYERALASGVFERAADANAFSAACRDARPLFLAAHVPVLAELHVRALRLFATLLLVHKRGRDGVLLTHVEIADALGTSVSSARRAMVALLERGYVHVLAPAFELHGAASSRRGNVYAVPDAVLAGIARVRDLLKSEQASGTVPGFERDRSDSSHRPAGPGPAAPAEIASSPCATTGCAQPDPEIDGSGTAPAADSLPVARQGETRGASPEAPDGAGDELDARWREVAALAAEGNTFAAELMRERALERARRAAYARRNGGGDGETN